jgi:hypothetical protein
MAPYIQSPTPIMRRSVGLSTRSISTPAARSSTIYVYVSSAGRTVRSSRSSSSSSSRGRAARVTARAQADEEYDLVTKMVGKLFGKAVVGEQAAGQSHLPLLYSSVLSRSNSRKQHNSPRKLARLADILAR